MHSKIELLAVALLFIPAMAQGQVYPSKPVRLIVSTSAGSGADTIARLVVSGMHAPLGQQVVVENRPGASGAIAAEQVAKAPADGHTVMLTSAAHTVTSALASKLPYDLLRDFAPVTQFANAPNAVVAHPSLPVISIPELVKLAKAKPGAIHFASAGTSSPSFSAGAMFAAMAGINMLHVPYRGGGEAHTALLTGESHVMFGPIASTLPHVRRGALRLLAVTSAKRVPLLPEVPTVAEAGYSNYEVGNWYGMLVPAKTPSAAIMALRNAALASIGNADVNRRLVDLGYVTVGDPPEAFGAHIKADIENLTKTFRAIGVKMN